MKNMKDVEKKKNNSSIKTICFYTMNDVKEKKENKFTKNISLIGLAISIVSLFFSIFTWYVSYTEVHKEKIYISEVYDQQKSYFDGECIVAIMDITICNISQIDVSIVNINIQRSGKICSVSRNNKLPLNIASNNTEKITLEVKYELDDTQKEYFSKNYGLNVVIDEYEWRTYIEEGKMVENTNKIILQPFIYVEVITAKNSICTYKTETCGANVEF